MNGDVWMQKLNITIKNTSTSMRNPSLHNIQAKTQVMHDCLISWIILLTHYGLDQFLEKQNLKKALLRSMKTRKRNHYALYTYAVHISKMALRHLFQCMYIHLL